MSNKITLESLQQSIEKYIRDCIEDIILDEIADISSIVTDKVRGKIGEIAARCLSMYEIHRDVSRLVITVNTKDLKETP